MSEANLSEFQRIPFFLGPPIMLLAVFLVIHTRRMLRTPERRRKAMAILLSGLSFTAGSPFLPSAFGQQVVRDTSSSSTAATAPPLDANESPKLNLFDPNRRLREGTVIPPTTGRVVNLGRRWAFLPLHDEGNTHREFSASRSSFPSPLSASSPASSAAPTSASSTGFDAASDRSTFNRGIKLGWDSDPTASNPWDATSDRNAFTGQVDPGRTSSPTSTQHIILCENQMLQRIVEATRNDTSDDRWEITGEILEFFDENRLLIHTIRRAASN